MIPRPLIIFLFFIFPAVISCADEANPLSASSPAIDTAQTTTTNDPAQPAALASRIDLLDFYQADILSVLDGIAKKTGLNIVTNPELRGQVTLHLEDIPAEDALKIVLDINRLAYVNIDGRIVIMTADDFAAKYGRPFNENLTTKMVLLNYIDPEEAIAKLKILASAEGRIFIDTQNKFAVLLDHPSDIEKMAGLMEKIDVQRETRSFALEYVQPAKIKEKLMSLLTDNVGTLAVEEDTKKITITDTPQVVEKAQKIIHDTDIKRQVAFEGKIVQVKLKDEYMNGIDWEAIVSNYQKIDMTDPNHSNIVSKLSVGTVSGEDYSVLLEALDTVGELIDIDKSSVTTLINQPAAVSLDSRHLLSSNKLPVLSKNNQLNVKMTVLPSWQEPSSLLVDLSPRIEWSNAQNPAPVIDEAFLTPVSLKLKAEDTIVLGGLVTTNEISKTSKWPVFGDLPIVGGVFRWQNKHKEVKEYVIFLTPKVTIEKVKENNL